jgi:G3E family GTPase
MLSSTDLVDAISRVLRRDKTVDYLVVESTGLADPLPIVLTFMRSEFRDLVRVDSVITIADTDNFAIDLFESEAAHNQLRYADIILLNKCDLASTQRLCALEEGIRSTSWGAADCPHHILPSPATADPQRGAVPVRPVFRRWVGPCRS